MATLGGQRHRRLRGHRRAARQGWRLRDPGCGRRYWWPASTAPTRTSVGLPLGETAPLLAAFGLDGQRAAGALSRGRRLQVQPAPRASGTPAGGGKGLMARIQRHRLLHLARRSPGRQSRYIPRLALQTLAKSFARARTRLPSWPPAPRRGRAWRAAARPARTARGEGGELAVFARPAIGSARTRPRLTVGRTRGLADRSRRAQVHQHRGAPVVTSRGANGSGTSPAWTSPSVERGHDAADCRWLTTHSWASVDPERASSQASHACSGAPGLESPPACRADPWTEA
jgi:hypothetical protein